MGISPALAADLAALTQDLDRPDVDLDDLLTCFASSAKGAVASYLGMTITIAAEVHEISFTVRDSSSAVATSLTIPLTAVTTTAGGSRLVLYASAPGAFVDLAADLSYALNVELAAFVHDDHLGMRTEGSGLDEYSTFNQAVGVLI
jgi:hypothetical protein